jgi:hypothetical protein
MEHPMEPLWEEAHWYLCRPHLLGHARSRARKGRHAILSMVLQVDSVVWTYSPQLSSGTQTPRLPSSLVDGGRLWSEALSSLASYLIALNDGRGFANFSL